jgi:hypothetical protein
MRPSHRKAGYRLSDAGFSGVEVGLVINRGGVLERGEMVRSIPVLNPIVPPKHDTGDGLAAIRQSVSFNRARFGTTR